MWLKDLPEVDAADALERSARAGGPGVTCGLSKVAVPLDVLASARSIPVYLPPCLGAAVAVDRAFDVHDDVEATVAKGAPILWQSTHNQQESAVCTALCKSRETRAVNPQCT